MLTKQKKKKHGLHYLGMIDQKELDIEDDLPNRIGASWLQ